MDELELQVLDAPDDLGPRLVLADALEQRGDPRGSLILLQHGLAQVRDHAARLEVRRSIAPQISRIHELQDPALVASWELGFVRSATTTDRALELVPKLLAHPAGRLVRELTVASEPDQLDELAEAIAQRPRPSRLRFVDIGRLAEGRAWVADAGLGWGVAIARAFRNAEVTAAPHDRISHRQFLAEIAAVRDEGRSELYMKQLAPVVDGWQYHPLLEVRPGAQDAALEIHDDLSERVQSLLTETTTGYRFHQASDRTYAGYGNIASTLIALAPHLEDVRFIVGEWDAGWVDEYAIEDGELTVSRGQEQPQGDFWSARAARHPDDDVLRRFAARVHVERAGSHLRGIDRLAGDKLTAAAKSATRALDRAAKLDADYPDLWQKRGELARRLGEHDASERAFARLGELEARPEIAFDRAVVAFARGDDAAARQRLAELFERRPDHTAGRLIAGYLASRASEPTEEHIAVLLAGAENRRSSIDPLDEAQRGAVWTVMEPAEEDVVRTGRHAAVMDWLIATVSGPAAAAYLLGWAEIFRIRRAHGRNKRESGELAKRLYTAAAAIDPLAGSVHYAWSMVLSGKAARHALEQGLVVGPEHLCILGALGAAARKERDYDRAIELLERYVDLFRRRHTGRVSGLFWDFHLAELAIAHYENASTLLYGVPPGSNRPPGKPSVEALDRAEAALAPALALYEQLSSSQQRAGAGVFQCKSLIAECRSDHATALEWAERALAANDTDVYLWSTKAGCLNNVGRLPEALACARKALELVDDHWHAHLVIARVLAKQDGDRETIYTHLRRVVQLWSDGKSELATEPDLASLRDEPAFQALIKR